MNRRLLGILPLAFMALPSASSDLMPVVMPSTALHDGHLEFLRAGRSRQAEIFASRLAHAKTTGLKRVERCALAELYFSAVKPKQAKQAYMNLRTGRDLCARIANQRVMWIAMAAEQSYDGIEGMIQTYRKRFKPDPQDPYHLQGPVFGIAEHHQAKGEFEQAVKLVLDELNSLPSGDIYMSEGLPARLFESFEKTENSDLALRLIDATRSKIKRILNASKTASTSDATLADGVAHVTGRLHRIESGLRTDLSAQDLKLWRARTLLDQIDGDLAAYQAKAVTPAKP